MAGSLIKSAAKLVYYYMFATLYGFVGGWANVSPKPSSLGAASAPPPPLEAQHEPLLGLKQRPSPTPRWGPCSEGI